MAIQHNGGGKPGNASRVSHNNAQVPAKTFPCNPGQEYNISWTWTHSSPIGEALLNHCAVLAHWPGEPLRPPSALKFNLIEDLLLTSTMSSHLVLIPVPCWVLTESSSHSLAPLSYLLTPGNRIRKDQWCMDRRFPRFRGIEWINYWEVTYGKFICWYSPLMY